MDERREEGRTGGRVGGTWKVRGRERGKDGEWEGDERVDEREGQEVRDRKIGRRGEHCSAKVYNIFHALPPCAQWLHIIASKAPASRLIF